MSQQLAPTADIYTLMGDTASLNRSALNVDKFPLRRLSVAPVYGQLTG